MLSVHSCLSASSGNLTRSSWATCSGLHFFARSAQDHRSELRVAHHAALSWARLSRGRDSLGRVGQIPLLAVAVASQLATDRRHRSTKLGGDGGDRTAVPVQIGDHDPLLKREVPHRRRPGSSSQGLHRGIVQPLAGPVDDRSPVPPARPGTPVHADDPTGLRVAHPLPDQTYELLTLPRKNIPPMMPIASLHHVHRTPRSISALRRSLESATSLWGQCKSSLRPRPRTGARATTGTGGARQRPRALAGRADGGAHADQHRGVRGPVDRPDLGPGAR